jgi:hypothetical protein
METVPEQVNQPERKGLLAWLDRGNQRAMDHVRADPDAGLKALPYAKSDRARRTSLLLMLVPAAAGLLLGWIAGVVAFVLVMPILWKQEHHFFFGRGRADEPPPN